MTAERTRTLRPLRGNVIVEREGYGETTVGGIVVPETAREARPDWQEKNGMRSAMVDSGYDERRVWARVVAVGPGRPLPGGRRADPIAVRPGDRVVLEKWEGLEFRLDDRDLLLMDEGGVLAVVDQE